MVQGGGVCESVVEFSNRQSCSVKYASTASLALLMLVPVVFYSIEASNDLYQRLIYEPV